MGFGYKICADGTQWEIIIALTGPIENILAFNKLTAGMWCPDAVGCQNVMICLTYMRMKRPDVVTPFLQIGILNLRALLVHIKFT